MNREEIMNNYIKVATDYRTKLTKSVELVRQKCYESDYCLEMLNEFAMSRGLPVAFLMEKGIFFLSTKVVETFEKQVGAKAFGVWGALAEITHGYYQGQFINMLEERIVYPLKNYENLVVGLCGYDGESDAKYIYCKTPYFNRGAYIFGEENLLNTDKPILVGEGLADGLWLEYVGKEFGFNGFATCGVRLNDLKILKLQLNKQGIWYFPDRDNAGLELKEKLKTQINNFKTFYVALGTKDVCEYFSSIENFEENPLREFLDLYTSGEIELTDNEILL